jgi:HEAT repeat protein
VEHLLLDRAHSPDGTIRLPAVEVLSRYFGADPQVRTLLIDRARTDDDVQVRRAAVRGLGDELAGHAEVHALLRELIHDHDWSVRRTAVHALGRHFGADEDLRALFVECACNDPNPEFRRVAGQALTWLPGADPDQLPDVTDPES